MHEGGTPGALPADRRRHLPVTRRAVHGRTGGVDRVAGPGQPEADADRGVPEGESEDLDDALRVAPPGTHLVLERPDEPDALMAGPGEPAVDERLHAPAEGHERQGDDHRGQGRHPRAARPEEHTEQGGDGGIHDEQDGRERRPQCGDRDDPVDRPEVVPADRHRDRQGDGDRCEQDHGEEDQVDDRVAQEEGARGAEQEEDREERCRPREPSGLGALHAARPPQPDHDRRRPTTQTHEHRDDEHREQPVQAELPGAAREGAPRHGVGDARTVSEEGGAGRGCRSRRARRPRARRVRPATSTTGTGTGRRGTRRPRRRATRR